MTITYQIEREKKAGTSKKSIIVTVRNDSPSVAWRRFEAKDVPIDAVAATYISANYTAQQLWDGGNPVSTKDGTALEAAYNAASAVIDMTPPGNTPDIIAHLQIVKAIVAMLQAERAATKNGNGG